MFLVNNLLFYDIMPLYIRVGRFLCFSVFNLYFMLEKVVDNHFQPSAREEKKSENDNFKEKVGIFPDLEQNPDPLFHETDPRIRIQIHIKMNRIRNTAGLYFDWGQNNFIYPLLQVGSESGSPKINGSDRIRILIPGRKRTFFFGGGDNSQDGEEY